MNSDILLFFSSHPRALPLFEKLECELEAIVPTFQIRVRSTQISFFCRKMFGCVSFLPVCGRQDLPDHYLTVTFGLDHPISSPRIAIVTEPYPNRWTHHLMICDIKEIDAELLGWMKQAAHFALVK